MRTMDQKKKAGGERGVLMGKTSPQLEAFRLPGTRGEAMGRIEYHQEIMVIVGDLENAEEMMGILGEVEKIKTLEEAKKGKKKQALRNKDISCSVFSQTVLLASIRNAMLVLFLGTLLCYKSMHDDLSVIGEVPVQIRMGNRRKNRIQRKTLKNQAKEVGIN